MPVVKEFVAAVAMTGKGTKKLKILNSQVYSNKILKSTQVYQNTKEVKEGKNTAI
jgi:hypothetical protein